MAQNQILIVNLGYQKVHLEVAEKLGEGAFGTVTRAVDNRGVSFAVKHVVCHDRETYQSVAQEVEILLQLKHPNIVAMYGFEFVNYSAVLIMEFCSEGTLNRRLDRPVESMVQLQWMGQLNGALSYLHDSNIVHRDLKTENILLSDNDVKIADFGISRPFLCCKQGRRVIDPNSFIINEYLDAFMGTFAGTPFWIAPEVFDNHYNEKADIFSLGIIFYAICERQFITFQNEKYYGSFVNYKGLDTGIGLVMFELQEYIQPIFKSTRNAKVKALILSMLHFCPDERRTLTNVHIDINEAFLDNLEIEDTVANDGVSSGNNDNVDKVPKVRERGTRLKSQNVAITCEFLEKGDKPRRKTRSASKKNGHQQVDGEKPRQPSNKKIPAKVSYKASSEKVEDEKRQKKKKADENHKTSGKVVREKDKLENKSLAAAGHEKACNKKSSINYKTKSKKDTDKKKEDTDGTDLVKGKRKKKPASLATYV